MFSGGRKTGLLWEGKGGFLFSSAVGDNVIHARRTLRVLLAIQFRDVYDRLRYEQNQPPF